MIPAVESSQSSYGRVAVARRVNKRDLSPAEREKAFGMTRSIWLHLLREGGRWSTAEIALALKLNPKRVMTILLNMVRTNAVQRWEKTPSPKSRVRYGVTSTCAIPQGVTLADVVELAVVKES